MIANDLKKLPWYSKTSNYEWPYVTTRLIRYDLPFIFPNIPVGHRMLFLSKERSVLGTLLRDGRLFINAGYASDGATLAPDFKNAMPAVFLHDFMYQMLDLPEVTWTKEDADRMLYEVGKEFNFNFSWIYWKAVGFFGGFFAHASKSMGVGDKLKTQFIKE